MEILSIKQLSKSYGTIHAVQNLNLSVKEGEVFGILGPNGSGKTTTLGIILGVIKANSGFYQWNSSITHIGALLETPNFYPYLNLQKNLEINALIKQVDFSDIDRVLEITGLLKRKNSLYSSLSLGMKQRLALANVLLGNPQVLVLDEPTNGLDPQGIADVRQIIKDQAIQGKTIILASHLLDEVQKTCTHFAVLKKGTIIKQGSIAELLKVKRSLIVSSDDNERLFELLVRSGLFEKVEKKEDRIFIDLNEKTNPKEVNEFAFKNGIVLSLFEMHENSLEKEFLKMTK